ncbi:putative harbinger transposase-derived protein [Helianthus annuus]|uniref:Harbinger transposase-derived protein n=1 Tax=Helianthus annuus TaxID=4232 RepID=A0A9K3IJK6_HELAN|nr:putative harbinger transposase-derived protein [Helianthus annuus]KAJ0904269.1 putative harbinger transposase-derived protein [Helianthus annuus]
MGLVLILWIYTYASVKALQWRVSRNYETIVSIFSVEYLRSPNSNDITRLLVVADQRRFPGMLRSIDGMHWK